MPHRTFKRDIENTIDYLKDCPDILKLFWDEDAVKKDELSTKYKFYITVDELEARQRIICGLHELYAKRDLEIIETIIVGMNSCNWKLSFNILKEEGYNYKNLLPEEQVRLVSCSLYLVLTLGIFFLNHKLISSREIYPILLGIVTGAVALVTYLFLMKIYEFDKKKLREKRDRKRIKF